MWNGRLPILSRRKAIERVLDAAPPIARCSRSGVEHPTDGNVRRNSVQPRAQALPLLSAIFLSLSSIQLAVSIRLPSPATPFDTLYSDLAPLSSAGRATRQLFRISFPRYARVSLERGEREQSAPSPRSPVDRAATRSFTTHRKSGFRIFFLFFFFLRFVRLASSIDRRCLSRRSFFLFFSFFSGEIFITTEEDDQVGSRFDDRLYRSTSYIKKTGQ